MTRLPDDLPDPERGDDVGGERGGVDVEAAWAEIVAHWSDEAAAHTRSPQSPVADDDEERLVDITDVTDVTDPARTDRPAAATDGAARPAAPREQGGGDDPSVAGDQPTDYGDYPPFPRRGSHRLTPEEVAELADESWDADADHTAEDRRSTHDWRRSSGSPWSSHVGGEEARSGSSPSLDDAEGFVPPEPPPMPHGDIISRLAWTGALGAPLFLLVAALFWRDAPSMLVGAAVVAFVAGFVALVVRMPDRSDDEDDGAVV